MKKKIGDIWEETDYSVFRKLVGNRPVDKKRRDNLIKSISIKDILNPILVTNLIGTEGLFIIEGQGRYEARRFLKKPIQYIQVQGLTIEDCKLLNAYNEKWKRVDHMNSGAETGNPDFIRLQATVSATGIALNTVMRIAGHSPSAMEKGLRNGDLVFTEEDAKRVVKIDNEVMAIWKTIGGGERKPNDLFYGAVKVMMDSPDYNRRRFLKNCERTDVKRMGTLKEQLQEFSRVQNLAKRSAPVHFEDYMRNRGRAVRDYSVSDYTRKVEDVSTLK